LPPVRLVVPLESREANDPPVAFRIPALVVVPIVPAEMLDVPETPTFRLPRLPLNESLPPVTLARPVTVPTSETVPLA
jgi:hypothetical protein